MAKAATKLKPIKNSSPKAKPGKITVKNAVKTAKAAVKKVVKPAKKPANENKKAPVKKPVAIMAVPQVRKPEAVKAPQAKKSSAYEFGMGDLLVYPTHGVGEVVAIEKTQISGLEVVLYVLSFKKEKMTLRVPVQRAKAVGLRALVSGDEMKKAVGVLKSKARTSRGMWSRRATEYGQKINSGNILSIAEVVRDLHKNVDDPDRSYSERIIYESAFGRLAGEFAAVQRIDAKEAEEMIAKALKVAA